MPRLAGTGDMRAFVQRRWLIVNDVLIVIDLYLPTVFGMGFAGVYVQKLELILQFFVDLVESIDLGAPDRASITAELQRDRPAAKTGQIKLLPTALAASR